MNLLTFLSYHLWIFLVGESSHLMGIISVVLIEKGHFHRTFHNANWVWLYTSLYFVGGGPPMIGSMVATIVADIKPEAER